MTMTSSNDSIAHDFGTLRALLHRPPSHATWMAILELLEHARRHDPVRFEQELFAYADHMLSKQWPQHLLRLPVRHSQRFYAEERRALLPLVKYGVTLKHLDELVHHTTHFPDIFIARLDIESYPEHPSTPQLEVFEKPLRLRELRLSGHTKRAAPFIKRLLDTDQEYLTHFTSSGALTPTHWKALCAQSERTARLQALAIISDHRLDETMAELARADLRALRTLKCRSYQKNAPSEHVPHHVESLCDAPWSRQLTHLTLGDYNLGMPDETLWQRFMETLAEMPHLEHLAIHGWRMPTSYMERLNDYLEASSLRSLHLEHVALDPEKLQALGDTTFNERFEHLHIKGEALTLDEVVKFASKPGLRGKHINFNVRMFNKLAKIITHPEHVKTINARELPGVEVLNTLPMWQHVEHLIMPYGRDDKLEPLLDGPYPESLKRLDLSQLQLSLGMWERLSQDSRYDRVHVWGEKNSAVLRLQHDIEQIETHGATSLYVHAQNPQGTLEWLFQQPCLSRIEQLEIAMWTPARRLVDFEQAWSEGRYPRLQKLVLHDLGGSLTRQLDFIHGACARALDLTFENQYHGPKQRLSHPQTMALMTNDLEQGVLDRLITHRAHYPVETLQLRSRPAHQDLFELPTLARLPEFESVTTLMYINLRVDDLVRTLTWIVEHCPRIVDVRFLNGSVRDNDLLEDTLAIPGLGRLETLLIQWPDYELRRTFQERFENIKLSSF